MFTASANCWREWERKRYFGGLLPNSFLKMTRNHVYKKPLYVISMILVAQLYTELSINSKHLKFQKECRFFSICFVFLKNFESRGAFVDYSVIV